jgi:predicted Zn-dependent protease with MMP-like domain
MQHDWETLCEIATREIENTIQHMPEPLRKPVKDLPILFEPAPNEALVAEGMEPDTLGYFGGREFADVGDEVLPPQIVLFLRNIEDFAGFDLSAFREEVKTTFLHEVGHYLGLDEGELEERGLE